MVLVRLPHTADARDTPIGSGGFGEEAARVRIAGFGEVAAPRHRSVRAFGGDASEIGHSCPRATRPPRPSRDTPAVTLTTPLNPVAYGVLKALSIAAVCHQAGLRTCRNGPLRTTAPDCFATDRIRVRGLGLGGSQSALVMALAAARSRRRKAAVPMIRISVLTTDGHTQQQSNPSDAPVGEARTPSDGDP